MKSKFLSLIGLFVTSLLAQEPISQSTAQGLRLFAYKSYIIMSPAALEGRPTPKVPFFRRQISAFLENCGDKPLTVPTHLEHIDGSRGPQYVRNIFYHCEMNEHHKRTIVPSPYKYQPVTLAPGDITKLTIYTDKELIRDVSKEKEYQDSVTYFVSDEFAKRYGW